MKFKYLLMIIIIFGCVLQKVNAGVHSHHTMLNPKGSFTKMRTVPLKQLTANTAGSLDTTFGIGGVDTLDPLGYSSQGNAMALQPDGKIIIAGTSQTAEFNSTDVFSVARFDSNGIVDNTFGTKGWAVTSITSTGTYGYARAHAVAVQQDGKIVVVGNSYDQTNASAFGIARFNSNGTIDSTFGNNGSLRIAFNANGGDFARSVVIQPDGKIIAVGRTSVVINYNGSNVMQYYFAAARFTQDGKLDSTFGVNGTATVLAGGDSTIFEGTSAALQTDGKILIAGYGAFFNSQQFNHFIVARLDSNGTIDSTFGKNGISNLNNIAGTDSSNDVCYALAVQSDGKILLAGSSGTNPAIALLNPNGTPDNSFGNDGSEAIHLYTSLYAYTNWTCNSVCVQSDGKIIVGGNNEEDYSKRQSFALCRLNPDGSLDDTFADSGWATIGDILNYNIPAYFSIVSVKIAPDGKIIAGGSNSPSFNVARFLTENTTTAVSAKQTLPISFQLLQNYPNPFNPSTIINFSIVKSGLVTLKVYNILGELVRTLVNKYENSGKHKIFFDADNYGLASGVYFYRLKENNFIKTDKMVYLK